ncbi:MAG: hypothetical protein H6525_02155 [Actinobacteria bacterium]|nr:hypothetical protein [Actinomycetota bacterium]
MVGRRGAGWRRAALLLLALVFSVGGLVAAPTPASAAPSVPTAAADAPPAPRLPARDVMRIGTGAAPGATAWGNLTVTASATPGWIVAYPCDEQRPLASNINFGQGETVSNFVGVRTDARGAICVYSTAPVHVLFDLTATSDVIPASAPVRVIDTRNVPGAVPVPGRSVVVVPAGAPAGSTVWGNLTIVTPSSAGWAVAFPCDEAPPWSSSINFAGSTTRAGFVGVRTDDQGNFCVLVSTAAHVIFDRVAASSQVAAGPPRRLVDTRLPDSGGAPVPSRGTLTVPVGAAGATVWGTLTIPAGPTAGWAVAYPCDEARPEASAVNYVPGRSVANMVAVRADAAGNVCVYSSGEAHVVLDVVSVSDRLPVAAPVRKTDTRTDWSGPGQVITVAAGSRSATRATIALWQRRADGTFELARGPVLGWVGELGIGEGAFGVPRTPEGYYALTEAFGILDNPGTSMPYFKVDRYDWWDGDPTSPTFNTHVRKTWVPGAGSERLIDYGYAYYYGIAFDYNPEQNPAKGSAFFFHVSTDEPTGGCVSVPIGDIQAMLRVLDPARSPAITIGLGGWGTAIVDRANRS